MHEFLSSRNAAKYIGKSEFTLRWWRTRDMGPPYYRQNRSISYSRADLDEYLEARRCVTAAVKSEPQPKPPHSGRQPKSVVRRRSHWAA